MPPNWTQGHHGAHCPIADCLVSIRAGAGQDMPMESTAGLVLSASFRTKLVSK